MHLQGTLLKVEDRAGDFTNDRGENVKYDFVLLSVWSDDQLVEVKVPRRNANAGMIAGLVQGSTVNLEVQIPKGTKPVLLSVVTEPAKAVRSA